MLLAPAVHAFVMAGGCGSRLLPLTGRCCKPALPFGGNFRVVDFVLANLLNSGVVSVDLLVQHQPQALLRHVHMAWTPRFTAAGGQLGIVGPRDPSIGFRGTADAVRQQLPRLLDRRTVAGRGLVLVFGADHVYRMDVRQMIAFHLAHHADATLATLPVPLAEATGYGIVDVEPTGRAWRFEEKPAHPRALPGRRDVALASMGNYVFDADVLRHVLGRCDAAVEHDFGHHVLPRLIADRRVMAYDFTSNAVPGAQATEEPHYWRDVGTLDAYFEAHLDTVGDRPRFNLDNPRWPIACEEVGAPPRVLGSAVRHACIAADAVVEGARLDSVVVGRRARVEPGAQLERCVVLDDATIGAGAIVRNAIVDAGNTVPPGETIGVDPAADRARFVVTERGVVVVPRGCFDAGPAVPCRDAELAPHAG